MNVVLIVSSLLLLFIIFRSVLLQSYERQRMEEVHETLTSRIEAGQIHYDSEIFQSWQEFEDEALSYVHIFDLTKWSYKQFFPREI